jgi:hypothetical protein
MVNRLDPPARPNLFQTGIGIVVAIEIEPCDEMSWKTGSDINSDCNPNNAFAATLSGS